MGKKELTNRQLSEILGYALERAEKNINQSVDALESERKRIETFKVDTGSVKEVFSDANKSFKEISDKYMLDLYKFRDSKSKEVQIKEWLFYGYMMIATIGCIIWAGISYWEKSEIQQENIKMQDTLNLVNKFFNENLKQREAWNQWYEKESIPQ